MIQIYNGANEYELHLNTGKSVNLTDDEIREIAGENQETLDRLNGLTNETNMYKEKYERKHEMVESIIKDSQSFKSELKDILNSNVCDSEIILKLQEKLR